MRIHSSNYSPGPSRAISAQSHLCFAGFRLHPVRGRLVSDTRDKEGTLYKYTRQGTRRAVVGLGGVKAMALMSTQVS